MKKIVMEISKKFFWVLLIALCFTFCSKPGKPVAGKKRIQDQFKKLISVTALETAGFEHIAHEQFVLLLGKEHTYVLNKKDRMVARFENDVPQKVYKAPKGQAPKEMISPRSIFFYDSHTLAVHDYVKASILFFDRDLNYIKEVKIPNSFYEISPTETGLMAFLFKSNGKFAAFLDNEFNIIDTFIDSNTALPFEEFFSSHLNRGFFLNRSLVSHSYWVHPYKDCTVNVYDTKTREIRVSLCWRQKSSLSSEDVRSMRNMYFTAFVQKVGKYFVIQNIFLEQVNSPGRFELLIFDENGRLIIERKFPYQILPTYKYTDDPNLYVLDKDEDISYVDVRDIIESK